MEETGKWLPTRNAKYGVVIQDYSTIKPYPFLPLRFGDLLQIVEEKGGWYRGFSLRDKSRKGVFPASHIHIKECTVKNPGPSEVVMPKDDPMAQEIADVLREWNNILKSLYVEGKRQQFQELCQIMKELLDKRRSIISKTLPMDELRELKQKVANKINYGNRFTGLDMIPRADNGDVINPKESGVMKLYKTMSTMAESANQSGSHQVKVSRTGILPSTPKREEHHLFLKFSALALPVNEPCDLLFFLYDGKMNRVLSERYMISLSQQCLPKNPDKIGQCFAVFTDIDSQDLQNPDFYLACQVVRVGNELEGKKTSAPLRKPHGGGIYPLHELMTTKDPLQEEKEPQIDIYTCNPSEYHKLLENVAKKQGVYHPTEKGTGVFVSVRVLRGPLAKVKEENPLLFRKFTAVVKKMSFAEIIRPYDQRHDVYLTFQQGYFGRGNKRADKNVQVDMEVLNDRNVVIQKCIAPGVGEDTLSVYQSLVHYHLSSPIFNETVKIQIPPDEMKTTRVKFSFYHKSTIISSKLSKSEPFAVSHLRLMKSNDTAIMDGVHELYVYNFKDISKNPKRFPTLPDVVTGSLSGATEGLHLRDSFSISTRICSTKLTQDANLHGLLNWQSNQGRLNEILKGLRDVTGGEIVKFLSDTFNALFSIIEEKGDTYSESVYESLVHIIGVLVVEKYENFRPVLDTYCQNHFSAASIHIFLIKRMKYVLEQVMRTDGKRQCDPQTISMTMKASEFLFKFIMRSRHLYDQATQGKGNEQFIQSLQDLLRVTCCMMAKDTPEGELVAPKAQAQAMQFLPQIFDLLLTAVTVKSLAKIIADFLMSIKETKLRVYKREFLSSVVSSQLFKVQESRSILLPSILRHLKFHINERNEVQKKLARDDFLEKTLEIIGNITILLHSQPLAMREDNVRVLVNDMLQILLECFSEISGGKERPNTIGVCVANIMALVELMTPDHYRSLRHSFDLKEDLEEFVLSTFHSFSEILSLTQIYPSDWTTLKLHHNFIIQNAIQQFSKILIDEFLGDSDSLTSSVYFNYNLWERFFQLAIDFCCQPSLQLEGLSELQRNRVLDLYGDMRMTAIGLVLDKWRVLGNFQSRFVPGMIGPYLKVSLLPHDGLRRSIIPVFFDMMEYQWKFQKNFSLMEREMIDKLDLYVSEGMGDQNYRDLLQKILTEKCKLHPMADGGGMSFIESLAELLKRLLDYRAVPRGDEYKDLHMHVVFNLLNFYKSIGREEIYLRYIYRLAELHKSSNNWVEAAFTLLLHAELLQWSSFMLKKEAAYPRQSSGERKLNLYDDIIDYFDKGKLWECGITYAKDIAEQLESVTFDYEKLSKIHQTISRFYTCILHEVRAEPMYFKVGFYGGFPLFFKNKVFIFRGQEFEKLPDFNARLSSTYPNAKFLKFLETPGIDIMESPEQFMQCCSVEPLPEQSLVGKFDGKQVKDEITRFYQTNYVKQFVLKRPFHIGKKDKKNEYKTLNIERTVYTTHDQFPGILRWFEVKDTNINIINPVENGANLIEDNIAQLKLIMNKVRKDKQNTNPLTMKLNGTLDAAVNGGVSNFDAFFTHEYLSEHTDYKAFIPRLKKLMEELGRICSDCVDLHREVCPETMRALHERMEELLLKYLSKYGGSTDSFLLESPTKRRMSSSRRRDVIRGRPTSGNFERSLTVSGQTSPIMERKIVGQDTPPIPEHRNRSQTDVYGLSSSPQMSRKVVEPVATRDPNDYDEPPPKLPTKHRRTSITSITQSPTPHATPPPTIVQNSDLPPVVPNRKGGSIRTPSDSPNKSRPTSFSSSGEGGEDGPRPPPRVTSVRRLGGLEKSMSKESLDRIDTSPTGSGRSTPQHENMPRSGSVRDLIDKMDSPKDHKPPPLPQKKKQRVPKDDD